MCNFEAVSYAARENPGIGMHNNLSLPHQWLCVSNAVTELIGHVEMTETENMATITVPWGKIEVHIALFVVGFKPVQDLD